MVGDGKGRTSEWLSSLFYVSFLVAFFLGDFFVRICVRVHLGVRNPTPTIFFFEFPLSSIPPDSALFTDSSGLLTNNHRPRPYSSAPLSYVLFS